MNSSSRLKSIIKILSYTTIVVGALHFAGVIGFHVPKWIDAPMPSDAVRVVAVTSNRIHLSTRQTLVMQSGHTDLQGIRSNDFLRVNQDAFANDCNTYFVEHFTTKSGYCGTPYTYLINIPIFTDRIPRTERRLIGIGQLTSRTP